MSADDFWLIRKSAATPGKFVALHATGVKYPEATGEEDEFDSAVEAVLWAQQQGSEYGASLHPECGDVKLGKSKLQ